MSKMIELPEVSGKKVFVTPTRVQAVEVTEDRVVLVMNTAGFSYEFYDDKRALVLAALIEADLLPGKQKPPPTPMTPTVLKLEKK